MTIETERYLIWLVETLHRVRLSGLVQAVDERVTLDLAQAYMLVATDRRVEIMREAGFRNSHYFDEDVHEDELKPEYSNYFALPDQAVIGIREVRVDSVPGYALERAALAVESVQTYPHLVLLGAPGAGKSIFLRHLAWTAAQQALAPQAEQPARLPVMLPLRALAGALAHDGVGDRTVAEALVAAMEQSGVAGIGDMLSRALASGLAMLLFDGLDEVSLEGVPGVSVTRLETLRAVTGFMQRAGPSRAVLTCRTRAFDQLRAETDWPVETLAPWTPAQVRHFIPACYSQLIAASLISPAQAERTAQLVSFGTADPERTRQNLMRERARREQLFELASTPLLLSRIVLQPCGQGELPRDCPQLYQAILDLLLGDWDRLRDLPHLSDLAGQGDCPRECLLPLLDELAYESYGVAPAHDDRGRLDHTRIHTRLRQLVAADDEPDDPAETLRRCIDWLVERSGIIVPVGADASYQFAYLALQHFCVARHLALRDDDPVEALLRHRHTERWREPILLGAGLLSPATLRRLFGALLAREEHGAAKPAERWQRDLILVAEIGEDRTWTRLHTWPEVQAEQLQTALRHGLAALLADRTQPVPTVERVRAAFLLGRLGDPRYPTTIAAWRQAIEHALAADRDGYFCRVEPGTYWIGSDEHDRDARPEERPLHRFELRAPLLIARYPITNQQWQLWLREAGQAESTYDTFACYNTPNQPVFGVSWQRCNAFCAWLSRETGAVVRLPTEQEWEAAARGGDVRRYPWSDEWHEGHTAGWTSSEGGQAQWHWTTPVGCFPAGAAPCGALDMTGNVRQWTASIWQSYPGASQAFADDGERVVRGAGYDVGKRWARVTHRIKSFIGSDYSAWGFRVVVTPRPDRK